jgi:hypothetical protein
MASGELLSENFLRNGNALATQLLTLETGNILRLD